MLVVQHTAYTVRNNTDVLLEGRRACYGKRPNIAHQALLLPFEQGDAALPKMDGKRAGFARFADRAQRFEQVPVGQNHPAPFANFWIFLTHRYESATLCRRNYFLTLFLSHLFHGNKRIHGNRNRRTWRATLASEFSCRSDGTRASCRLSPRSWLARLHRDEGTAILGLRRRRFRVGVRAAFWLSLWGLAALQFFGQFARNMLFRDPALVNVFGAFRFWSVIVDLESFGERPGIDGQSGLFEQDQAHAAADAGDLVRA